MNIKVVYDEKAEERRIIKIKNKIQVNLRLMNIKRRWQKTWREWNDPFISKSS